MIPSYRTAFLCAALLGCPFAAPAQKHTEAEGYNFTEARIPPYILLDPLTLDSGAPVKTPKQWWSQRRPEILRLFEENVFGHTPANAHVPLRTKIIETDPHALGGRAIRKQIDVYFTAKLADGPKMRILLYLPAQGKGPVPVILGLNFAGNQSVLDDPAIQPTPVWKQIKPALTLEHVLPDDKTRGSQAKEWQVDKVLAHGYGLATIYYGDLEADFKDASQTSIRQLFGLSTAPDSWGAVGAWAWGLSRAVDYLVTDPQVDAKHIAVTGHSRLGKAADWAVAQDPRIAALLSTESGHGGQSIQRRALGESVKHLEESFPYWFCPNYAKWVGHDHDIPADGNLLLSLIAPRPLYVASAVGDEWSDPRGEFLSAVSVSRVYTLFGKRGLPSAAVPGPAEPVTSAISPGVDQPIASPGNQVAYHNRSGVHDVTAYDWDQYLNFLDGQWPRPNH